MAALERTIRAAEERLRVLEAQQRRAARGWSVAFAAVALAVGWNVINPAHVASAPTASSSTLYAPVVVEDPHTHRVLMTLGDGTVVIMNRSNNKAVEIGAASTGVGAVAVYDGVTPSSPIGVLTGSGHRGELNILSGGRTVGNLQANANGDASFTLRRGDGRMTVTAGALSTGQGVVSTWTNNTTGIIVGDPSVIVGPKP